MRQVGEIANEVALAPAGAAAPAPSIAEPVVRAGVVELRATVPALPMLPTAVEDRLRWIENGRDPVGGLAPRDRRHAEAAADRLRRMLAPVVDTRSLLVWLERIAQGVGNAPPDGEWEARCRAMYSGLDQAPDMAFRSETVAAALRRFRFWPAVAEVHEFVEEVVGPHRRLLRRLEAILRAPGPQGGGDERPPRTPEEIAHVRALAAANRERVLQAERDEVAARKRIRGEAGPVPIDRSVLVRHYEQAIEKASTDDVRRGLEARLAALRASMAQGGGG
jgi:hypothetical protein